MARCVGIVGVIGWVSICACGPTAGDSPASAGGGGTSGTSESGGDPIDCTAIADGVARARIVDDATIEVLMDDATPDVLPCDGGPPNCGFQLHRLAPSDGIVPGTFVAGTTSTHEVDYCWCCNGEDGGPDEDRGTRIEAGSQLVIEAVSPVCAIGSFEAEGREQRFVAQWCD